MITLDDLALLREVPPSRIDHWIDERAGEDVPRLRWWFLLFEDLEHQIGPVLAKTDAAGVGETLAPVPCLVESAIRRGEIEPVDGAHWMLRLALQLLRHDIPVVMLPEALVLDVAARWAMQRIPFTRESALAENRRQLDLNATELAGGPVGEFGSDRQGILLGEVFAVLHHLAEAEPHLTDPEARREASAWMVTYRQLLG